MVTIIKGTETPLTDIGVAAGICWHANATDYEKNVRRAIDCIESGHGRVMEYPDVTLYIEGYSARCIRELYTHIIGTTRLQESTRYVDEGNFTYYTPDSILRNDEDFALYKDCMDYIKETYKKLEGRGIPKEDVANLLPLGMHSGIVLKINVRAIEHFANMRMCARAYKEIRALASEMKRSLEGYSEEWKRLVDIIMVPKCKKELFCTEKFCCGAAPKKEEMIKALDHYRNNQDDGR